jgi:hypothetical protein
MARRRPPPRARGSAASVNNATGRSRVSSGPARKAASPAAARAITAAASHGQREPRKPIARVPARPAHWARRRGPHRYRPADRLTCPCPCRSRGATASLFSLNRARSMMMLARPTSSSIAQSPNSPPAAGEPPARAVRARWAVRRTAPEPDLAAIMRLNILLAIAAASSRSRQPGEDRQALGPQPLGIVERGEIAEAGVAQDRGHRAIPCQAACPARPPRRR